jgi:hypothetical protein
MTYEDKRNWPEYNEQLVRRGWFYLSRKEIGCRKRHLSVKRIFGETVRVTSTEQMFIEMRRILAFYYNINGITP